MTRRERLRIDLDTLSDRARADRELDPSMWTTVCDIAEIERVQWDGELDGQRFDDADFATRYRAILAWLRDTAKAKRAAALQKRDDLGVAVETWTYAVRTPEGFIKIGRSEKPWRRLDIYQTIFAGRVEMVAVWLSHVQDETQTQRALRAHHVRGEIYKDVPEVVAHVRAMMARCERGSLQVAAGNQSHARKHAHTMLMGRPHNGGWDGVYK